MIKRETKQQNNEKAFKQHLKETKELVDHYYYVKKDIECKDGITVMKGSYVRLLDIEVNESNLGTVYWDMDDHCKLVMRILDENNDTLRVTGIIPLANKKKLTKDFHCYDYKRDILQYLEKRPETDNADTYGDVVAKNTDEKYDCIFEKQKKRLLLAIGGTLFCWLLGLFVDCPIPLLSTIGAILGGFGFLGFIFILGLLKFKEVAVKKAIDTDKPFWNKIAKNTYDADYVKYLHRQEQRTILKELETKGEDFELYKENDKNEIIDGVYSIPNGKEEVKEEKAKIKDAFSDYPDMFNSIEVTHNYGDIELVLNKTVETEKKIK